MPYNKYYKQKKQVSYDEGQTWEDIIPYEYQKGTLYEVDSPDCRYLPEIKFILTYSDGSTFTKYCNEYSYISGSEVMEGGQKSEITEIFIGSCVNGISTNAFNGVCKLKRVNSNVDGVMNIPEGVLELGENAFTWTCSSCYITSITLPSTLQRLSLDSFDSDYCHQTLTVNAVTPPYMYLDEYDYFPKPIYVPCQSVSAYKTASGWSTFKDYIYGIPPCAQPKLILSYSDGRTYEKECDGTRILSMSDTKPEGYQASAMTDAVIGSCVGTIGRYAFSYCDGLTSINIPDNVRYIELHAFAGLKNLKTVYIGKGFCYAESSIFNGCEGLISITIEATTPPVLDAEFGNNWFNDTNNCPIYVPCQSLNAYKTASGWSQYADRLFGIPPCVGIKWTATRYPSTTLSAECDASSAITENEIPAKWSVTSVEIGDCVTSLGYRAFQGFSALTSVTLSNSIKSFSGNVFESCDSLTSITVPNSVTEIGTYAFWGCIELTNVILSTGITKIGEKTFLGCINLTGVTIPNNVTAIDGWAFQDCYSLTSVGPVGSGASIEIPNRVASISEGCFYRCSGLTSVIIPNSITEIGGGAFEYCTSLTSVTIPNSVTSIGGRAFFSCSGLTSITVNAPAPPTLGTLGGSAFYDTNNCPIYVPANSVNVYKSASGWSQFADRIFPIT